MADKAKHWLTQPLAAPVPIEKSADLEMDGREDFQNLLCKWEGKMSKTTLRMNNRPRRFLRFGCRVQTTKSAEASAEAAYPLGERNALLMALLSKVLLRYFWQK